MSKFTHNICEDCWNIKNPDKQVIKTYVDYRDGDKCCYCGNIHCSDIFVRDLPSNCACNGEHD